MVVLTRKDCGISFYLSLVIIVLLMFCSQGVNAKTKKLNIRHIIDTHEWNNKELNHRMLLMSSDDFVAHWKERSVSYDFFSVGDYFLYEAFMPHDGFSRAYLCYNPKINKLSLAYREMDWDSGDIDKGFIYVATEESVFPLEIFQAGFGEIFYNDSIVMRGETHIEGTDTIGTDRVRDCILSKKYAKVLRILEMQKKLISISSLNVWDSLEKDCFVGFREYVWPRKRCKIYNDIMLQCIKTSKKIFYDVDALNSGVWWPTCYLDFEDGHASMEYVIKAYHQINKKHQFDSDLAKCRYDLAVYQMDYLELLDVETRNKIRSNLTKALDYYSMVNSDTVVAILYYLGYEYQLEKDYSTAQEYLLLSLAESEKYYGTFSCEYAFLVDNLRNVSYLQDNYQQGCKFARQYVDIVNTIGEKSIWCDESFTISKNYSLPHQIYSDIQAEQEHKLFSVCQVANIRSRKMEELEKYYKSKGEWNKVTTLLREELYDNENYNHKVRLDSLIEAYHIMGDYKNEERYKLLWLDEVEQEFGKSSEKYAMALLALSKTYQSMRDTARAFECADNAFDIEYAGDEHFLLEDILKGCGEYAVWAGYYKTAATCYRKIIKYREKYGLAYQNVVKSKDLEPLANIYLLMGDTVKAIDIVNEIIQLGKQPDGVVILNDGFLGDFCERIGNDTVAISFYYRGGLYEDIERLLYKHKDYKNLSYFVCKHLDSIRLEIGRKMLGKREADRESIWGENNRYLTHTIPIYCYEAYLDSFNYSSLAYDAALFTKGYLLSVSKTIQNAILSSSDENLIRKWRELLLLQDVMSQPLGKDSLLILNERVRYIEQQILTTNKELIQVDLKQSATWNGVSKMLSKKEFAIEFILIPYGNDSAIYCALLLGRKWGSPLLIPLFEEKDLMSLINTSTMNRASNSHDRYGTELAEKIWSKALLYIHQGETIYFSPDGILHQLPLESLPYDSTSTMSDHFKMVRLTSTRELVTRNKKERKETAAIYGGIQYDVDTAELLAESRLYDYSTLLASRDIDEDTINRGSVRYLFGTKREAESISNILTKHNVSATFFTSTAANEESFKALSGKHQNIIHIGTHGFYWADSTAQKKDYFTQRTISLWDNAPQQQTIDPLDRCGLLFAGANMALSGHSRDLPEGVQDGILTAREISLMDLRDCDLVVLSACETAKGDITSEGVFGLQRAFKMAGVQTIIMSLWKVDDNATQMLMTEFYTNWIEKNQTKREAFRNAQNAVRYAVDEYGDRMYEDPRYWAGFVMLD